MGRSENCFLFPYPSLLYGWEENRVVGKIPLLNCNLLVIAVRPNYTTDTTYFHLLLSLFCIFILHKAFTFRLQISSPVNTPFAVCCEVLTLSSRSHQYEKRCINLTKEEGQGQVVQVCFPRPF